jgi:phosphatidylglycerophosphate synthase
MRKPDAASLLRIPLLLILVYAIEVRFNAAGVLILLAVLFISDSADGYLALGGSHSLPDFVRYLFEEARILRRKERKKPEPPRYAAYLDIAVDRIIEYALWLTFTLLSILPWFVIAIVFVRNTLADLLVFGRGKTFREMQTGFGRIASSHLSRGAYAILKAVNFGYLSLVAVAGWPAGVGYALTAAVVAFSLARGAAEISEALR